MKKVVIFFLFFKTFFYGQESISTITKNCNKSEKIEFYKSMFFVNGHLASMNIKTVLDCTKGNNERILGQKISKNNDFDYKGYKCECNDFNQLGCHKQEDWICSAFCWGECKKGEKYSYEDKYISLGVLFNKMPEDEFLKLTENILLKNGKVEGFTFAPSFLKYFNKDEISELIAILMNYDPELKEKISILKNYLIDLEKSNINDNEKKNKAINKYEEIFNNYKMNFKKYDNEILKELFDVYNMLINITLDKKYIIEIQEVFKSLLSKNEEKEMYPYIKNLGDLYLKTKSMDNYKKLQQEYPYILRN